MSVGSRARRGKMLQRTAVALLATVCKYWVYRSCEYSILKRPRAQRCHEFEEGPEGGDDAWEIEWFQFCGYFIGVSM